MEERVRIAVILMVNGMGESEEEALRPDRCEPSVRFCKPLWGECAEQAGYGQQVEAGEAVGGHNMAWGAVRREQGGGE